MFIIRLSRLSMTRRRSPGEDLVRARRDNIDRPILAVKPDAEGGLNVGFTFRTRQEAERISSAVPLLGPADGSKQFLCSWMQVERAERAVFFYADWKALRRAHRLSRSV